jgi:hypothetical protein
MDSSCAPEIPKMFRGIGYTRQRGGLHWKKFKRRCRGPRPIKS